MDANKRDRIRVHSCRFAVGKKPENERKNKPRVDANDANKGIEFVCIRVDSRLENSPRQRKKKETTNRR